LELLGITDDNDDENADGDDLGGDGEIAID